MIHAVVFTELFVACVFAEYISDTKIVFSLETDLRYDLTERLSSDQGSVCYDELGCFGKASTFHFINQLPASPESIDASFTLHTRNQAELRFGRHNVVTALRPFLRKKRTIAVVVHGFWSSAKEEWVKSLKDVYLENISDSMVICVDWSKGARFFSGYTQAVVNSEVVGREIAVVLHKMMKAYPEHVKPEMIHYVGHSVGAQISRSVAVYFKILNGKRLGKITALDAAAPVFEKYGVGLNPSHADFVEAIHTSAGESFYSGHFGVKEPIGHIDFYVNGGSDQKGCSFINIFCAHKRAYKYYIEAIKNSDCIFRSFKCEGGLSQYFRKECIEVPHSYNRISLNESTSSPGRGIAIVETTDRKPYCKK